ncbi:MAG: hypothetical protein HY747_01005 [Elusimicrobia bacterium]|nr:hypothetical protein [Elusimicrobiota bacterium]
MKTATLTINKQKGLRKAFHLPIDLLEPNGKYLPWLKSQHKPCQINKVSNGFQSLFVWK